MKIGKYRLIRWIFDQIKRNSPSVANFCHNGQQGQDSETLKSQWKTGLAREGAAVEAVSSTDGQPSEQLTAQLTEQRKRADRRHQDIPAKRFSSSIAIVVVTAVCVSLPLTAAILPEDRLDTLYHRYAGDHLVVDGPSILARKQIGKHFSIFGNMYQDSITSATIDVVTQGSPYEEHRDEYRAGFDYLYDNTTMNLSYVNSKESDYEAETYSFNVSHDMFGELTTVSLGYAVGKDYQSRNTHFSDGTIETNPVGPAEHYKYSINLSQVITKNFILGMGMEIDSDEGKRDPDPGQASNLPRSTLNNPYRGVLIRDSAGAYTFSVSERYPQTRTSIASSIRGQYYLPYRAALGFEVRQFADSWDIKSSMYEIKYVHPIKKTWILDFKYRVYDQTKASFYRDFFDFTDQKEFMARDKELSTYTSTTWAFGVGYEFWHKGWWIFDKGSMNFSYNQIQFDYVDFTDRRGAKIDQSIPFSFTADVYTAFFSAWY